MRFLRPPGESVLRFLWCVLRRYHDWRASGPGHLICADCGEELQANPCAECPLFFDAGRAHHHGHA